nr:winged helix-turn-helix domain-containing protein [Micromonospora sp. DSM 115978]
MLRIIFSSEDIARTRVALAADPVWESVLSLHLLQGRPRDATMTGWRREVSAGLRREIAGGQLRMLFALNPARGYFPDFLTPSESAQGLEAGLDAIARTPVPLLHRDVSVLAAGNPLPPSATAVGRGEPAAMRDLVDAIRSYHGAAVEPYWQRIEAVVESDRARRVRSLLDGGAEGLLASLRPTMRWEGRVLEVPGYPSSRELHLDGRGLLLVPSFFCARTPVALLDPTLPPVLVYPVDRLGGLAGTAGGPGQAAARHREALGALLGRTRASVLEVVGDGCSTGEVARKLRISPAAASQHATVLRNAGLLVSHRDRNTVLHTLTPLGRAMLNR